MKLSLRTVLIAACMLFGVQLSIAQSTTIRGIIADRQGDPLIGATILVKGTTTGSITDVDGTYSIAVANTPATLVFSYTGYSTQEVQVTSATTTLDVTMEESVGVLDEVIVVAYGTAKKGSFTGSATQINAEALEGRALTNVSAAIEGAAGIQFSPGDGQPGASSGIRVRGFGSVNASSEPLYVVDGIIFSGSLSSINPNDVESITVLKDASSTALYGSKAANGVVMITTKGGRKDAEKLTLNISRGVTGRGIAEYDRISAEEYYPVMWEAYRNSLSISGSTPLTEANQMASDNIFGLLGMNPFNVANDQIVGTDGLLNPNAQLLYPGDLDWQEPLVRAGDRTNVDLSYQGATEKTSFFASMSYLDDKGWILNSDFQRVTGRINVNMQPKDWIRTGFNLS
ncbi:MAG: TonB-dependent receptor plug domain-containing protein, partial [Cyanothece sp. SIO1E1]|nr:TonB-dependent receptor plug domain-containing protein [Cyanothece sp. SIO1E1]